MDQLFFDPHPSSKDPTPITDIKGCVGPRDKGTLFTGLNPYQKTNVTGLHKILQLSWSMVAYENKKRL
jgi:hypothetical protein